MITGKKHNAPYLNFSAGKFFILTSLCCTFCISAYAQTDTAKNLTGGVISYVPGGFFRSGYPTVNGEKVKYSYANHLLYNYQPSQKEYTLAATNRTWTYIMGGAAIACAIASLPTNGGASTYQKPLAKAFIFTGVGFLIPEYIFATKARKHYREAQRIYNQQF